MILLGCVTTKNGKSFDCRYLPKEKVAEAIGPLPDRTGARGIAFTVSAESEQEAMRKLSEAIEQTE